MKTRSKEPKQNGELIRDKWPKIREIIRKGSTLYQVDARKTGTLGKQESFSDLQEAKDRADAIEADYKAKGGEGLALPAELRFMVLTGEAMLKPYGKTVLQACEFYRDYLKAEAAKQDSQLVGKLSDEWYAEKQSGKFKKLRPLSLQNIKQTAETLKLNFGEHRILSLTTKVIRDYVGGLDVGTQTKKNIQSLFSQFFNWCIASEVVPRTWHNPAKFPIEADTDEEVTIWEASMVENVMRLCETEHPEFLTFYALGLFGGLRPFEALRLDWKRHVSLEEKLIHITKDITKVKEDRHVPINDTLQAWLSLIPADKRHGEVVRKKNFSNAIKRMRAKLGYKYLTKGKDGKPLNPDGEEYPEDVCRHSYGSYWLALHKNRAQLAEDMGNTPQIIARHYKKLVAKEEAVAYFEILPKHLADKQKKEANIATRIRQRALSRKFKPIQDLGH